LSGGFEKANEKLKDREIADFFIVVGGVGVVFNLGKGFYLENFRENRHLKTSLSQKI
jgi:predicted nucleic acid-binding Zn ribbon protein